MRRSGDSEVFELFEAVQPELPLGPAPASRRREPAAAERLPRPWHDLLRALTEALAVLDTGQRLLLEVRSGGHFVGISLHGAAGVVAETAKGRAGKRSPEQRAADARRLAGLGWERLPPGKHKTIQVARAGEHVREWSHPAPFAAIALLAVRTLREVWGAAHPRDVVYGATDARQHDVLLPALRLNRLARRPDAPDTGRLLRPASRRELADAVLAALRSHTGLPDLTADADGDVGLARGGISILVSAAEEFTAVDLIATLATDAEATPALLAELNDANRHHRSARFFHFKGRVIAAASVPCEVFVPELLTGAFEALMKSGELVRERLREKLSGALFLEDDFEWADTGFRRTN
jgi:hypothetical protein